MMVRQLFFTGQTKLVKIVIYSCITVFLILLPLFIQSPYLSYIFTLCLIYIIASSSLRIISLSGQMSLGHAGFMGIGAYFAGVLSQRYGCPPWITMPLAAFVTMGISVLVGYPFTRLRSIYFAMVSIFFGVGIIAVIILLQDYTGGNAGLIGISPLFSGSRISNYYFFLAITAISLLILYRIETCRIGVTLKTIAQSHMVASSIGINESGYRVLALAIGCFFVGLAGAGYAHYNMVLSQNTFGLLASINLVIYMFLGGTGSLAGPIIGTVILIIIPELLRTFKEFTPYISVAIMLLVIFIMPQGIIGLPQQIKLYIAKLRERKNISYDS